MKNMPEQGAAAVSNRQINLSGASGGFAAEVSRRAKTSVGLCWHCLVCAAACPFLAPMGYPPVGVLRLVQLGQEKAALESASIWGCVGCHSCSDACPNSIDVAAIMDVLREMAMERGVKNPAGDILSFHQEVVSSIAKYGRTHKLSIMMKYKLGNRDFFSDAAMGTKMLLKGKLDLFPSRVSDTAALKRLFEAENGKEDSCKGKK